MADIAAGLPKRRVLAPRLRSFGDDRLGRLAAAGDKRAFAVVYERHHEALYRYCRSILGNPDDAADALQNTMAAALRGLQGETRAIRLKPWLFRIAHNECVTMLRTRGSEVAMDDALEATVEDEPLVRERLRQLMADLQELTPHQRGAIVMRELSALSYDEVALVLGGSPAAARQTVYEARTALHELAQGRAMDCEHVQRALSDNDGRVLRGRKLRSHLRACGSCRDFRDLIKTRKHDLACIAPPLPLALAGGAAASKAFLASGLAKGCAAVACTAAVAGGTVEAVHVVEQSKPAPAHHAKKHHAARHVAKKAKVAPAVLVKSTPVVASTGKRTPAVAAKPVKHRHHSHRVGHRHHSFRHQSAPLQAERHHGQADQKSRPWHHHKERSHGGSRVKRHAEERRDDVPATTPPAITVPEPKLKDHGDRHRGGRHSLDDLQP
jgi:RNA polymerase sigma factor (sigma-70 family)